MTFPDFQRLIEWCQNYFAKMYKLAWLFAKMYKLALYKLAMAVLNKVIQRNYRLT